MVALIVFAFLAGAGTALSPCVLPVLPVVLSAGVTGGRRRPLGIVVGLVLSFTFAILALVYVIDALGLPDDLLRNLAIVVLAGFGLTLLVPPLAARLEGWISRFVPQTRAHKGDGFGSGLLVGLSLGVLYAPCAGPILAGVITVSASQSLTTSRLAVAFAYALGSAVVLYFLLLGGRRLTSRIGRRSGQLQMAMGALMVLVALLMLGDYDTRFQTRRSPTTCRRSSSTRPRSSRSVATSVRSSRACVDEVADSPVYGIAPELTGNQQWFNTPGAATPSLRQLRGRVVLIDFWTYTCINCIRTLPYLKAWDEAYRIDGLTIIGVHTPEFPFERDADNVAAAIEQNGLRYPVVQDNDYATWNAYGNQYWPSKYLVDARGRVRYAHFGEGEYEETEKVIRELLAEAGRRPRDEMTRVAGEQASTQVTTPETYLGAGRAERFANGPIVLGTHRFRTPPRLGPDQLAYGGSWRIRQDSAVAGRGREPGPRLRRPPGLPRPRLASRAAAPGAGAARRRADHRSRGRPRCPRRHGDDHRPAPLSPRRTAASGSAPPLARTRSRRLRLRIHVRMRLSAATIGAMAEQPNGRTVLVVDDEPTITEIVARYLERAGYDTTTAATGPQALQAAAELDPDLVVLDLMLPEIDGFEVLRRLQEDDGGRTPVILLTAKGEHDDKLAGLRRGADDYVVKPFSPTELVARVDAVLRRVRPVEERTEPIVFDGLEIDPRGRRVTRDGAEVQLSQREFDLLLFLASNPGQAFSRDQLIDRVWNSPPFSDTSTVTVHIRRLRAKIEPDPEQPRFIQTLWGVGYRFQP